MVGPASNECPGPQRIRMASYNGADQAAPFAALFAAHHAGELVLVPRLGMAGADNPGPDEPALMQREERKA